MQHTIQALRIASALWVVLYHLHVTKPGAQGWWGLFTSHGYLGVDIFFVISGFIMALNTQQTPHGPMHSLRFALLRLARIYSGWWPVCLLSMAVLGWLHGWPLNKDLAGSWWLYSLNIDALLLPVTWSLTFELYFYAVVAASLLLRPRWRTNCLLGLAALVLILNSYWFSQGRFTLEQLPQSHWGMYLFASPLCLEFALGYALQRLWQPCTRRLLLAGMPWLLLALVSAVVLLWYGQHHATQPSGLAGFFHYPERAVLGGSLAVATLVLTMQWGQWLPKRLSLWGGDISYMVYLVHLPVIWITARLWPSVTGHGRSLLVVAATLLLASALHHAVEKPLYRTCKLMKK